MIIAAILGEKGLDKISLNLVERKLKK